MEEEGEMQLYENARLRVATTLHDDADTVADPSRSPKPDLQRRLLDDTQADAPTPLFPTLTAAVGFVTPRDDRKIVMLRDAVRGPFVQ